MKLKEIVPWGRSLAEYKLMFALSESDLGRRILGCGDGPASFNAEMTALGHSVVSVDPLYQFSSEQIRQRVQETYEPVVSQVRQNSERYVWKTFQDADELGAARLAAMETFLQDYEAGRYRFQALPELALADRSFDLCVCSHLLFTYSEHLPLDFHIVALRELLQVAAEVRIFPLLDLKCEISPHLDAVIEVMSKDGAAAQVRAVDYEFQKGGNQMLVLRR